jgi:response regulator NasT
MEKAKANMKSKSLRLVIADNESIIRLDLREMLEEAGHEVVGEAIDGRKAVDLTRMHRPDLVIMDIKMPDMDGITAARKISEAKLAPVLLLTAFSQPEIVEQAKDSGVLGYLVKPVKESNLFPAMEIALSRWQEMQGLEQELDKLKDSLELRKTIDRAKGILMAAHKLSEDEAYRRIQRYAMAKRVTIKEVAEAIVKAAGGKV